MFFFKAYLSQSKPKRNKLLSMRSGVVWNYPVYMQVYNLSEGSPKRLKKPTHGKDRLNLCK
jgi:hypothetical protein